MEQSATKSILFSALSQSDQEAFLKIGKPVNYTAREVIFGVGEPGETMIFLQSGRVEISITSINGRKSVLNHMGDGEVLGEIALLDGGVRSADAVATDAVHGRIFNRVDVLNFLRGKPDAMQGMIVELCHKIRNASEMFEVQSQIEAPARLARCLLRLSAKWGERLEDGAIRINPGFSQTDLGDFAGLTRESVNRHLRKWEVGGVVRLQGGDILVLDQVALEELAKI